VLVLAVTETGGGGGISTKVQNLSNTSSLTKGTSGAKYFAWKAAFICEEAAVSGCRGTAVMEEGSGSRCARESGRPQREWPDCAQGYLGTLLPGVAFVLAGFVAVAVVAVAVAVAVVVAAARPMSVCPCPVSVSHGRACE
jgi:hypothetical protein